LLFTIRFGTAVFYFRVTLYMNDIKISVVIPSYNAEKYIARCIDSVLNTGYENLEIICVNDGSKDGTLAVLRDYEKKYDCIKVIDTPNGGVARARNLGIENLSGDFVTFLDADDWIHPQFFSILLEVQKEYNSDISVGGYVQKKEYYVDDVFNKDEEKVLCFDGEEFLKFGIHKRSACMRLYRTSVIKNVRFYDGLKYGEDMLFNFDLYSQNAGLKTTFIGFPMYYYYSHDDSKVSTSDGSDYISMCRVYMERAKEAHSYGKSEIYLSQDLLECFSSRYHIKYSADKQTKAELNKVLFDSLKLAKKYKCFSFTKYMCFQVFARFPFIYRWFRIIKDPTILEWEKFEKEKCRQKK